MIQELKSPRNLPRATVPVQRITVQEVLLRGITGRTEGNPGQSGSLSRPVFMQQPDVHSSPTWWEQFIKDGNIGKCADPPVGRRKLKLLIPIAQQKSHCKKKRKYSAQIAIPSIITPVTPKVTLGVTADRGFNMETHLRKKARLRRAFLMVDNIENSGVLIFCTY
jgi:hypothetical protein